MLPQNDFPVMTLENMDALDKPQYQEVSASEVIFRERRFCGLFNAILLTALP
jgi:hypothetical protein